uniref:Uncharacterized protein n=1 Tax=Chromera velia CCMP2878 TaxID=1169474 RepID=A0A0G4GE04_9ALVE|eukprot:Cvel_21442.t1-p1 / transcript=Cvel_21442.t1 / gene=Cvel_21442 / organism=Chromera_velia_CCMP2878 / gene_product=hypothetical protein / transcript_product=hypothetical protein / location=Cvel_scaffold2010:26979-29335(+) / protein_length=120 / sequence_SO=supercontig / SO=protein_coding / is_pseudo=false
MEARHWRLQEFVVIDKVVEKRKHDRGRRGAQDGEPWWISSCTQLRVCLDPDSEGQAKVNTFAWMGCRVKVSQYLFRVLVPPPLPTSSLIDDVKKKGPLPKNHLAALAGVSTTPYTGQSTV